MGFPPTRVLTVSRWAWTTDRFVPRGAGKAARCCLWCSLPPATPPPPHHPFPLCTARIWANLHNTERMRMRMG